ncbi:hypothetical protein HHK36_004811 [Tetracentron sinense]|uniref:Uncharacterized protein n=1 Tax=Tetracentron sinense TaxID=13715 RepID=A0A834ZP91_TETSI|nr:hypothetical protein HHK36_004811 [Tetracentron sinense]
MINGDGNLVVASRNQSNLLWSTNITVVTMDSIAKLSNSGNFVLIQNNSIKVLWQSFDYRTHTYLPGMKIGLNRKTGLKWFLTWWKSPNEPAGGNFSYALDPRGSPQYLQRLYLLCIIALVLDDSGTTQRLPWVDGFEPKSPSDWYLRDGSVGCVRKRESSCGKGEGFLKLERVKLPDTSKARVDRSLSFPECQKRCFSNCSCSAYSSADVNGEGSGCVALYDELMDIRDYPDGGQDLYVCADATELAANARRNSKGFLGQKRNLVILIVSIVLGLFLLVSCGCFLLKKKRRETKVVIERRHERLLGDSLGTKELDQFRSNPELPFFDLSILVAATENFCSINMLGKGGFGPVYKAWDLWNEGRALDIVDSSMVDSCPAHEASRCIHVGLLCVQESAENRPTMPTIVFMLDNETTMPPPKQPAYVTRTRNAADLYAIQSANCSINEVTMTTTEAR